MLSPFVHPVTCCSVLLRVVAQSLKPVKLLATCKRRQQCWELLRPFARILCVESNTVSLVNLLEMSMQMNANTAV